MERYPQLVIATKNLQHNFNCLKEMCRPYGIRITAVTKGFTSVPEACQALWECHPRAIATSRIDQVKKIKEYDPSITTELLRIPALSECDLVVKYADISLNSELAVLQKLNDEALKQGKIHRVILMKDIGDRREGFESEDVMIDAASMVEYGMPGLKLYGIGANFGCYGSICVSKDKVDWLADIMEKIEAKSAVHRRHPELPQHGPGRAESPGQRHPGRHFPDHQGGIHLEGGLPRTGGRIPHPRGDRGIEEQAHHAQRRVRGSCA